MSQCDSFKAALALESSAEVPEEMAKLPWWSTPIVPEEKSAAKKTGQKGAGGKVSASPPKGKPSAAAGGRNPMPGRTGKGRNVVPVNAQKGSARAKGKAEPLKPVVGRKSLPAASRNAAAVRQLRHHFGTVARPFSAPTHSPLSVCRGLLVVHVDWELVGS